MRFNILPFLTWHMTIWLFKDPPLHLWAFSSGGLMATAHQNLPSGDIFEVLQILKSSYCIGHIHALEQAEAHIFAYMDELDDNLPDLE